MKIDPSPVSVPPEVELDRWYPDGFIVLKSGEHQTITITFSSPPEDLWVKLEKVGIPIGGAHNYSLQGSELKIDVYCPATQHFSVFDNIELVPVTWNGGGTNLQLLCPNEHWKEIQ